MRPSFSPKGKIIPRRISGGSACQKSFDKLVDGEASSTARCRASNLRFEPSAVSPKAKPENPKGFQPLCHPHQSPLKIKDFSGAETARKRFFLWKIGFTKPPHAHAAHLHCPSRQRRQEFFRESRKTREIGDSNLWSTISCTVRRQQVSADSACPAVATGCRPCLPTVNPRRISWIRRPWPLQFMAANGRR